MNFPLNVVRRHRTDGGLLHELCHSDVLTISANYVIWIGKQNVCEMLSAHPS